MNARGNDVYMLKHKQHCRQNLFIYRALAVTHENQNIPWVNQHYPDLMQLHCRGDQFLSLVRHVSVKSGGKDDKGSDICRIMLHE